MDSFSTHNTNVTNPELVRFHEGATSDSKSMSEIGISMEILTKVDLELAYSSEKLLTLESLLLHILSREHDFEAMISDDISMEFIEKTLKIDLLFSFLDSEVKELDGSMEFIRVDLVAASQRLFSCKHLGELFSIVQKKLRDSEDSFNQSREHVLEMKMKLAKLQMTSLAFSNNECFSEDYRVLGVESKPRLQTIDKVHVLRMLEKSLSRELDLEKKLTESKQDEEDLKLKLRLTEQIAFITEEAAEVVWGRFLEAENASVVLTGVCRDLVAKHQLVQFNLNGVNQREDVFRMKLENCIKLLNTKDASIEKLNSRITQLVADNLEVLNLREKVNSLEEKVNESESNLEKAVTSNESFQERVHEMENTIESLKDNVYEAENRAETNEEKVAELTESNMELTEELGFVKGSHEESSQKMNLLEKQSRELEIQLKNVKASSETAQEQQNMLYSAIWDMETLIDELKQKVSIAEIKVENAEEKCLLLTDTNSELTKEIEFLRAEVESLETSLSRANLERIASVKDISIKTKLIMDTVMQLATERERITKQLRSQTKEKIILMETLQKTNHDTFTKMYPSGFSSNVNSTFTFSSQETNESPLRKNLPQNLTKVSEIEVLNDVCIHDPDPESSVTDSNASLDEVELQEPQSAGVKGTVFKAVFVVLVSVFVVFFVNRKPDSFDVNAG